MLGEFDIITGPVAALYGFHDHRANHMHVCYNQLLGMVEMPDLHRNAKAAYLEHYCKQNGIDIQLLVSGAMAESRCYAADSLSQSCHQAGNVVQPHGLDEAKMVRPTGAERQNRRQNRQAMM